MLRSMGRGRAAWIAAAVVCVVVALAIGARWWWLRDQRQRTEQHVATLTIQVADALALLREVETTREGADARNTVSKARRDQARAAADALNRELSLTKADTTAAEIGAYTTGAQANNLRACLTGVSQALNQLAVGDSRAIGSLRSVDGPCRAVGIR